MTSCDDDNNGTGLIVTWEGQYVEFRWRKTEGTKRHTLKLRHVKDRQHLIIDADVYHDSHKCKIEGYIRYGQVYEMMVEFVWPNEERRKHSGWKEFILGGKIVPVYPSARLNLENPQRSVVLTWQHCETKAEKYRIIAKPSSGQNRLYTCSDCTITISKLKSNTEYTFEVQALFEDNTEGPACTTDKVSTLAKSNSTLTTQSYKNMRECTLYVTNPTSVQHNHITKVTDPDFGKVRNVEMNMRDENGVEKAMVQWEEPLFHGEHDDYEILHYKVTVKQEQNKIRDWIYDDSLCTEEFMINLGKLYVVSIATQFQEIDTEKLHCADFKKEFYSRPTRPTITITEDSNLVLVEWFCESGAEEYRFEVYESKSLVFTWEDSKNFRYREIEKKKLKMGRSYKFRVIAFAKGRRSNDYCVTQIIGGDEVVMNASAVLNKDRPLDAVDISWQSPEIIPVKYKVLDASNQCEILETAETFCTVNNLRSGIKYQFEVIAVYDDHDGHPVKTDCVTTDPRPERILRVVCASDDQRPDTCVHLNWAPSKSATMYKIRAKCPGTEQEHTVAKEKFVLSGLKPETIYEIYVSSGNEEGFGEEYFVEARTEIEVPVDVILTCDEGSQTLQATCGSFEGLEAIWMFYKSDGNQFVESVSSKLLPHQVKENTEYYATVKFRRGEQESRTIKSNTLLTVPSQLRDVHATRGEESPSTDIHVEWTPLEGLSYELEFETDHYIEAIIRSNAIGKCHYRCLQEGNNYSVKIRAQNATGYGEWSQKEYVSLGPPKIRNLTAVTTDDSLTIHWQGPRTESLRFTVSHFILKVISGEKREPDIKETTETSSEISPCVPGETYKFSVAAVNSNNVVGEYESGKVTVGCLLPVLHEDIEIEKDIELPWRFVTVKWRRPAGATHFRVVTNSNGESQEHICKQNFIRLERMTSDRQLHIKIYSATARFVSDVWTTKFITMADIPGIKHDSVKIVLDNVYPWKYAKLQWELPDALECAKVTIESIPKWGVKEKLLEVTTQHTTFRFERTTDISTYLVKIQSGYFPDVFSEDIAIQPFQMGPDCPKVTTVNQVNDPRSKFVVYMEKQDFAIGKVLITASSEYGTQKSYERDWSPEYNILDYNIMEITDLPPGQTYSLHIESFFESHRRPKELIGTYELRPPVVLQLQAYCINRNTVVLKWLPHEDQNTKYRVRWESENEPKDTGSKICDEAEAELIGLRNGVKYECKVCAYVGECHGPEQVVTTTTGWSGDEIFKILVAEEANRSKISAPLLPISVNVESDGVLSLSDLIEKYQGKKILILGEQKSGKSTVCREICKQIAGGKTQQTLPIMITSDVIIRKSNNKILLDRQWNRDFTKFEQNLFIIWMQSHSEQITYIIDDAEREHGFLINMRKLLTLFSQSTVFFVGSSFEYHFLGITHYVESSIHIDYSADQISQHLSLFGSEKAEAWNEIRQHFSDLCFSPKHFFAAIDFVKNDITEKKFSSPAWVYSKVYQTILKSNEAGVDLDMARKDIVQKIKHQYSRLSDLVRFGRTFNVSSLNPPATPDEKFMLALEAVYFSPPLLLLSLLRNCDDKNILLLCADCIHQNNRFEIFKLFPHDEWEEANSKLESNITALKNTDVSFMPKLGKEFRDTFNSAAGMGNIDGVNSNTFNIDHIESLNISS